MTNTAESLENTADTVTEKGAQGINYISQKAHEYADPVLSGTIDAAKQFVDDSSAKATDLAETLYLDIYDALKKNPAQSIATVLLLGIGIGTLIGRTFKR